MCVRVVLYRGFVFLVLGMFGTNGTMRIFVAIVMLISPTTCCPGPLVNARMYALRAANCTSLYNALVAEVDQLCEIMRPRSWQTVRDVHEAVDRAWYDCKGDDA